MTRRASERLGWTLLAHLLHPTSRLLGLLKAYYWLFKECVL